MAVGLISITSKPNWITVVRQVFIHLDPEMPKDTATYKQWLQAKPLGSWADRYIQHFSPSWGKHGDKDHIAPSVSKIDSESVLSISTAFPKYVSTLDCHWNWNRTPPTPITSLADIIQGRAKSTGPKYLSPS